MLIKTNYTGVIFRFVLLLIMAATVCVFIKIVKSAPSDGKWLLFMIMILFIFIVLNIGLSFFGIIKVQVDEASGEINFHRLFTQKQILSSQISSYRKSVYNTKGGTGYGLILTVNDQKLIELNPGNLKDVMKLEAYLKQQNIEFLGETRSFYPFTTGL